MSDMRTRMLAGQPYIADDPELDRDIARAQALLERFNATRHTERALRRELLAELFGACGADVTVLPSFRCDYGSQIRVGAGTFVNYDCVVLDVAPVTLGAQCWLAPRVQLLTATHAIDPAQRRQGWESSAPITLGDNVWLGGGVIVCPGVRIGADTTVGAGAVVTRDLPGGVVAAGNPARVMRAVSAADRWELPERG